MLHLTLYDHRVQSLKQGYEDNRFLLPAHLSTILNLFFFQLHGSLLGGV